MHTEANIDALTSGLLTRFLQLDLDNWSRESIVDGFPELGWTAVDEGRFHTGLDGRIGHFSTDLEHDPAVSVSLAGFTDHTEAAAVFAAAGQAVTERLGPPQLCGGPGPWWRWRASGTSIRLRFATLPPDRAYVNLEALHTDRSETWEVKAAANLDEPPYAWRRTLLPYEVDGLMSCGDQRATDWADLTTRLTDTLSTLIADLPLLEDAYPAALSIEEDWEEWHTGLLDPCVIRFDANGVLLDHRADPTAERVAALSALGWDLPSPEWIDAWQRIGEPGWQEPETGNSGFTRWFTGGQATAKADAAEAAALVVGAIRSAGTRMSRLAYRTIRDGESLRIHLPGLGI